MNTFLERLQNNQLTNIDQYRKMQKAIAEVTAEDTPEDTEEWKNWELAPVSSGAYSDSEATHSSASSEQVVRALNKLDQ